MGALPVAPTIRAKVLFPDPDLPMTRVGKVGLPLVRRKEFQKAAEADNPCARHLFELEEIVLVPCHLIGLSSQGDS